MVRKIVFAALGAVGGWLLEGSLAVAQQDAPVAMPPRFQVELIAFSLNGFDPTEEHLEVIPLESEFHPLRRASRQRLVDAQTLKAARELIGQQVYRSPLPAGTAPAPADAALPDNLPPQVETALGRTPEPFTIPAALLVTLPSAADAVAETGPVVPPAAVSDLDGAALPDASDPAPPLPGFGPSAPPAAGRGRFAAEIPINVPEADPDPIILMPVPRLEADSPAGMGLRWLNLYELELLDALTRLEQSERFEPLLHLAWEQYGMAEEEAIALWLEGYGIDNPSGSFRLHMNRFLHLRADLAYTDAASAIDAVTMLPSTPGAGIALPGALADSPAPRYYLLEQRRLLRDELNYFDHPAIGLIVVIRAAPDLPAAERIDTQSDGPSA